MGQQRVSISGASAAHRIETDLGTFSNTSLASVWCALGTQVSRPTAKNYIFTAQLLQNIRTVELVCKYKAGYFGKSKLFNTKIFCIILLLKKNLLILVRKQRRVNFRKFSCLLATSSTPAPSRRAGSQGLSGRLLCQVSTAQSLPWLPSSAALLALQQYFSKLFAHTYNNIILSCLQSHHGAKSLPAPALKSLCSVPVVCFKSWTSEAVYFTFT